MRRGGEAWLASDPPYVAAQGLRASRRAYPRRPLRARLRPEPPDRIVLSRWGGSCGGSRLASTEDGNGVAARSRRGCIMESSENDAIRGDPTTSTARAARNAEIAPIQGGGGSVRPI